MSTVSTKTAICESHSKLILVGEHAVVYGKPAIAIPFPLKVKVMIQKVVGLIMIESPIYTGSIDGIPPKMEGIKACIEEALRCINQPFANLRIKVDSSIPLGRGLGSSAAIAIAITRSIFSLFGQKLSEEHLFSLVQIAETYAHGKPSGIDTATEISEHPIWFQKEKQIVPLVIRRPLYIVVADTGRNGDTHTAVDNVRKMYGSETVKVQNSLDEIARISELAREALLKGDIYLLGTLLYRNHEELKILGVSDDELNHLVEIARNAGALGAKLTGGGLGGCMLALGESLGHAKIIATQLMSSGASNVWYFSTEENSLYNPEK
ncbi:mevalonate kinase [Clostridium folliculivorans]|uniref:mevalonate kinase n=1 Tax=Clostridium folliculivorans TaxID=2886038 RepID=A0A9W6D9C2_9CLOT|nr:mevalonate kinase [Clostridium folliculivorans]GKU23746.1 mevalonate kinase [Clostridium folliculivorans]GKU29862.1 mevalonate kinase [Clostridium folliculivorans]